MHALGPYFFWRAKNPAGYQTYRVSRFCLDRVRALAIENLLDVVSSG
jgi:hypothetical protein